jgi:adenylate cyclase
LLEIVRHIVRQRGIATSVIIVEDLHWLDEASEDFVMTLVEAVAGTRTMLVLNYRPGYAATWMRWPYFQELSLAELSAAATSELVEELIGGRPELHDIRERVVERSGGNPFFAEELVRSLTESGAVFGEIGNYSLGPRFGGEILPPTVQAVIGARVDRLGESEKAVLQTGAIIGKEFPLVVLQEVVGPLARKIDTILDHLCEAELIQEQATIDCRQFAFRHPLVQEVTYRAQLKTRRSALHASVAKAMEGFYRDRLNEFAGLLAYHYEAAGKFLDAANYAARAAKWVGSTNPGQAIKYWKQVRAALQQQPRSQANDSLRIMANGQIAWLGWREGMTADAAQEFIREALGWARETDDTMIPMLLFVDGRITLASGGPADTYVERVREALSLLKEGESAGRIATLNCALSQAYGWAGLLNEALDANNAAMQGLSDVEMFDNEFLGYNVEHWVMSLRGRILVRLGRSMEAQQCLNMLLRIEQTLLDPTVQFIPHLGYVDLAWCRGDAALAEKHALRVSEIAVKSGIPYLRVYAFACMGTAKSIAKDFAGAARDFTEGLQFVRKATASMGYEPEMLASLADCHYQMNEPQRAVALAAEAIDVARQRCTRLAECRASITFGAALLAEHGSARLHEAENLFRCAEDLIRITGARIYEPLLMRERTRISTLVA